MCAGSGSPSGRQQARSMPSPAHDVRRALPSIIQSRTHRAARMKAYAFCPRGCAACAPMRASPATAARHAHHGGRSGFGRFGRNAVAVQSRTAISGGRQKRTGHVEAAASVIRRARIIDHGWLAFGGAKTVLDQLIFRAETRNCANQPRPRPQSRETRKLGACRATRRVLQHAAKAPKFSCPKATAPPFSANRLAQNAAIRRCGGGKILTGASATSINYTRQSDLMMID